MSINFRKIAQKIPRKIVETRGLGCAGEAYKPNILEKSVGKSQKKIDPKISEKKSVRKSQIKVGRTRGRAYKATHPKIPMATIPRIWVRD